MTAYPLPDRRKTPRLAGMVVTHPNPATVSPIPPEAGNVQFLDPEPEDDVAESWPVTGRQILGFWMIAAVLGAMIIGASCLAAGYACGLGTSDIIHTVLAWGLA